MPTADNSKKNMSEKPVPARGTCSPAPQPTKPVPTGQVPTWIDPRGIPAKSRIAGRKLCQFFGI